MANTLYQHPGKPRPRETVELAHPNGSRLRIRPDDPAIEGLLAYGWQRAKYGEQAENGTDSASATETPKNGTQRADTAQIRQETHSRSALTAMNKAKLARLAADRYDLDVAGMTKAEIVAAILAVAF